MGLSLAPSALNPLRGFLKKSAPTDTKRSMKTPLPRLLRLPSGKKLKSKWSPSANPDTKDTDTTDITDMVDTVDTENTAKKSLKKLLTMYLLSLPLMLPSRWPTPNPSRLASTSPSLFPVSPAKIFPKRSASWSLRSWMTSKLLKNALLVWVLWLATRFHFPCPNSDALVYGYAHEKAPAYGHH